MSQEIFIVVWDDRHIDDVISVHTTLEGANARLEEHMADYDDDAWEEPEVTEPWVRYVATGLDDDPSGWIERGVLE